MFRNSEYKQILKKLLFICATVVASTMTRNWVVLALAAYGIWAASAHKTGKTIIVYLLLSFLPMLNPLIMPRFGQYAMIARLSTFAITLALVITGSMRHGHHRIPLSIIYLYLTVAMASSAIGYCPEISFLKILNFFIFITGLYIGTRNIHISKNDIQEIRHTFIAVAIIIVYGSLLTLPFPSIAYFTSLSGTLLEWGFAYANDVFAQGGTRLFSGITVHSQCLGPVASCCFAWILCDMWLVEKRLEKLHLAILVPIPIISFMTRSRLSFLVLITALIVTSFYCIPHAKITKKERTNFWIAISSAVFLMTAIAIGAEIKNRAISRWIRKTDDLTEDSRSLGDAITASRQGKIHEMMKDWQRDYLLGCGFQVTSNTKELLRTRRISKFSAPIEKGILPIMVLSETGILGALVFLAFLIAFFSLCAKKKYTATITLFIVFLSSNMGEATFFSPSGAGGLLWIILVAGGFIIDMEKFASVPLQHHEDEIDIIGECSTTDEDYTTEENYTTDDSGT